MSTRAARALQEAIYHSVAGLFYAAPRLLYVLAVDGASRFRHHPSTLVVVNHKRDLDSVLVPPTLLYNGVRPKRPMWFAGREDMFLRGFLATCDVVPAWFRRLLYEMDPTSVLAALRILPVRRFRERTMDEALREAVATLGDLTIDDALSPVEAAFWHLPGGSTPAAGRPPGLARLRTATPPGEHARVRPAVAGPPAASAR